MGDASTGRTAAFRGWVAALIVLLASAAGPAAGSVAVPDRPEAPDVTLQVVQPEPMFGLEGPTTTLAALRGQVVVMGFVDDSCAGCDEMADLLQYAGSGSGALALGVASGVDRASALRIANRREGRGRRHLAMVVDPDGSLATAFGVTRLPGLVVVDRSGRIAARRDAPFSLRRVDDLLAPFVAEPPPRVLPPAPRLLVPVSVLRRPATRGLGVLPRFLTRPGRGCPWVRNSLRLAARSAAGRRLIVGRALDGGVVAALLSPDGRSGSFGCGLGTSRAGRERAARKMRRSGLVTFFGEGRGSRPPVYALLVADGYDRVRYGDRVIDIQDNGVILEGLPTADSAYLEGPAGTRRVRFPPGPTARAIADGRDSRGAVRRGGPAEPGWFYGR